MNPREQTPADIGPEIVVSVGTDFHLFNRLIDWVDDWLAEQGTPPSCVVQYGSSREPTNALGISRLPRNELLELYASAKAVIVQGGPGSILDAREVGILPIAVPRRPEMHEVVDGHQIAFTKTMQEHGEALMAETEQELRTVLERAMANPESMRKAARVNHSQDAASVLGSEIERIMAAPRHPQALRRTWRLWRRKPEDHPRRAAPLETPAGEALGFEAAAAWPMRNKDDG
ncbi:glycosyltransferase [Paeniglutamicibacter psychrophenolicus]|uniref:glycosyltransferase n=1 Tax=Paeniglutamicibacter psychrophenolicus TaxID=257454 RepID=UPI00278021C1|nr:glycosyltransferase [Paeniglutamicibacter psychrophenolicus]MDQ0092660.1 UDP-N-acetylglucosamine transferase subunit ALG13 [Paeniglutamicibacter psychrophenolicus]